MNSLPINLETLIAGISTADPKDPLTQLEHAVMTAADLEEGADHLVGHFVDQARNLGYSWTRIGERIGVTKQAVRKRFAPPDVAEPQAGPQKVFGRYADDTRSCVLASQDTARTLGHDYIGTEHILLALCNLPETAVIAIIEELGTMNGPEFRADLVARMPSATDDPVPDRIPFTPRARKVLELASRQAFILGHSVVAPCHLLLAILAEGTGVAAAALQGAGIDEQRASAAIKRTVKQLDV